MTTAINTLEPRQIKMIGFGGLVLLVAALLMYMILPEWKSYRTNQSSLGVLRASAIQGDSLEGQLTALRTTVEDLEHTLNGDASNLPVKQMEAFVIGRLQTISWRNDIKLTSIQPRDGTPINQFRELIFDVELQGSYFEFVEWLQDVGEELGFVVVKQFQMVSDVGVSQADSGLKIKLTVAAYRNGET